MSSEDNVLYLGMADDIMSSLLLVPTLKKLFAISLLDSCYSPDGTWNGQKDYIKQVLINGNDKSTYNWEHAKEVDGEDEVHYLEGPSKITKDIDDGKVWKLNFIYMGKERELVYYHERDFLKEWPKDITNINHINGIGAFCWDQFVPWKYGHTMEEIEMLTKMFKERTTDSFTLYLLYFNHKHFMNKKVIKYGKERKGCKVTWTTVSSKENEHWIEQLYDPRFLDGTMSIEEFQ